MKFEIVRKNLWPACCVCGKESTHWDGGRRCYITRRGKFVPSPPMFWCTNCQNGHEFGLPFTFEDAAGDLLALRDAIAEKDATIGRLLNELNELKGRPRDG